MLFLIFLQNIFISRYFSFLNATFDDSGDASEHTFLSSQTTTHLQQAQQLLQNLVT